MSVAAAFLRRDFYIWTSYRLTVVWQLLGPGIVICAVYFAGVAFGQQPSTYGSFLLGGLAFTDIFFQVLNSPPQAIRDNQRAGTLERVQDLVAVRAPEPRRAAGGEIQDAQRDGGRAAFAAGVLPGAQRT